MESVSTEEGSNIFRNELKCLSQTGSSVLLDVAPKQTQVKKTKLLGLHGPPLRLWAGPEYSGGLVFSAATYSCQGLGLP